MPLDFPSSPTTGQTYTGPNGVIWSWDGAKWLSGTGTTVYAPVASPAFSGNPTAPTPPSGDADTSIATTQFVSDAVATSLHDVGRNYLHNSMFNVAQRGAGPWTATGYTLDRWNISKQGSDAASIRQIAANDGDRANIGDEAAAYAFQNTFTGSATAGSYHYTAQPIEGIRRLAGKTVTLSFWANSTVSLKLGINMLQDFGTGGSPSAATWILPTGLSVTVPGAAMARYSVTFPIPSISGKTLGSNGNDMTVLTFWYSSSSGTNALAGNIGVQAGILSLWGVQLELGPTATPLEKLDPVTQLQQCQRFYQGGQMYFAGYAVAGVTFAATMLFPVTMRANPTMVITNNSSANLTGVALTGLAATGFYGAGSVTASAATGINVIYTASADL